MSSEYIYAILVPVFLLPIGVIGFFFKKLIREMGRLTDSVNKLTTLVEVLKTDLNNLKERHIVVDKRLNEHGKRLDKTERDVAVLKSKSDG